MADLINEAVDEHSASDLYAQRFAGQVGTWFLELQEKLTKELVQESEAISILDVGGGHAQLSIPFAKLGYKVTVLGSNENSFRQLEKHENCGSCTRAKGKLLEIPFPDSGFDLVFCFRILPHEENWTKLISELCRVAKNAVIIDFPTKKSLNALAPLLFSAKKSIEKTTRPYRLFEASEIEAQFAKAGFALVDKRAQYFFPMVLHRVLKLLKISKLLEGSAKCLGLTKVFGSPLIAKFERKT